MKQRRIKNLELSKTTIAKIKESTRLIVKGGTDPISDFRNGAPSALGSQCNPLHCY